MSRIKPYIIGSLCALLLMSCEFLQPSESAENIARVNDSYLTLKEVRKAMPPNLETEDSLIFVQNYINRWATGKLLLDGAKLNLSQKKQDEYNAMVNAYRDELFTQAYIEMITTNKMDTTIVEEEIERYYKERKTSFRLKEDLIQLRYLQMAKDYSEKDKIKKEFKRYNSKDREHIEDESFKFETYSLMDSIWIKADNFKEKLGSILEEEKELLKKDNFLELSDSVTTYLIYIKDVRLRNEQAPMSYARPTIKQIILNRRKLQFTKEFEKDITKDALENNQFEIYK